jgi:hypothetical protein
MSNISEKISHGVAPPLLSLLRYSRLFELEDVAAATEEVKDERLLPSRVVMCVSSVDGSEGATQRGDEATAALVLAFAGEVARRVGVIVVADACAAALNTQLSLRANQLSASLAAQPVERHDGDAAGVLGVLGVLASLIRNEAAINVASSSFFCGSCSSVHRRGGLARLFATLPDAALLSWGTLQHLAFYTGHLMRSRMEGGQDPDLLLAAAANHRQVYSLRLPPIQWIAACVRGREGVGWGRGAGGGQFDHGCGADMAGPRDGGAVPPFHVMPFFPLPSNPGITRKRFFL